MSAAPEDAAGTMEPFSPSVFLDLPPTPRPDDDGDGEDDPAVALPDDLVLPFIERMLMEQDMVLFSSSTSSRITRRSCRPSSPSPTSSPTPPAPLRIPPLLVVVVVANKLHIVDYGVDYGCQWPNLLKVMSNRSSKDDEGRPPPPEVRMTCVGLPEPGFLPAARIEETGRRLAGFARRCGLPFTFRSVAAARWETVRAGDLDIRADEVLVVNSITQFQNLMDDDEGEGVGVLHGRSPSPLRDAVLNNIREMRPDVFVLSVANASYGAPFFTTRFREALFYYSAMFDVLDATAPRGDERRLVVERDLLGPCALNVVACEGADRVERPETYRQWQARCRRAGLRQLPLCPDVLKVLTDRVRKQNHKDFFVDVDRQWLVQGWKGRILYAMSTWVADDR